MGGEGSYNAKVSAMLSYVYGHNKVIADAVASLIPHCHRGFGPQARAIGVIDAEGRMIGGMVYNNWEPEHGIIEMSGAATTPRWLTRETLARIFQYPFMQCGCQMVVMRVPFDNDRLLRILAAYGFDLIKVRRMFGRDRDGVLATLTDDAWRENKFNRRLNHHLVRNVIDVGTAEAA